MIMFGQEYTNEEEIVRVEVVAEIEYCFLATSANFHALSLEKVQKIKSNAETEPEQILYNCLDYYRFYASVHDARRIFSSLVNFHSEQAIRVFVNSQEARVANGWGFA